jgi:hypothetical protein
MAPVKKTQQKWKKQGSESIVRTESMITAKQI